MKTFTHVGNKPNTTYVHVGRNFGHTLPKPGKTHALNLDGLNYFSLCGERISPKYHDIANGDEITDHVNLANDESVITCSRCRKALGKVSEPKIQMYRVQFCSCGTWSNVAGGRYATVREAELAKLRIQEKYPQTMLRTKLV